MKKLAKLAIATIILSGCGTTLINYKNPEFVQNIHSRLTIINGSSQILGLTLYEDPVTCTESYRHFAIYPGKPIEIITNLGDPITLVGGYSGGVTASGGSLVLERCYIAVTTKPRHQEYDVNFDATEEGCNIGVVSKEEKEDAILVKRKVITAWSMADPWCKPISSADRVLLGLDEKSSE